MSDAEEPEPEEESEDDGPKEPQEEEPLEKEWEEYITVEGEDGVDLSVRVGEVEFLEKWAMYALQGDRYWLKKTVGKMEEGVNPNITVSLQDTGEGYWELKPHTAAVVEDEEVVKEDDEEKEIQYEVMEFDLLTLVTSRSWECAEFLMSQPDVVVGGVAEWCAKVTRPGSMAFCEKFMKSVSGKFFTVDFTQLFEFLGGFTMSSTEHPDGFLDSVISKWQTANLTPTTIPTDLSHTTQPMAAALYRMIKRLPDAALDTLSDPLPSYITTTVRILNSLSRKEYPKALHIHSPTDPSITGLFKKRGNLEGIPQYYKGDPVSGVEGLTLSFHVSYGWRIQGESETKYIAGGVVDLLPMEPGRWHRLGKNGVLENADLYVLPEGLHKAQLGVKKLETEKFDPVMWRGYNGVSVLRYTDFFMYICLVECRRGLALTYEKILSWKTATQRLPTDPIAYPHLLLMSLGVASPDCGVKTVLRVYPHLKPLGSVDLKLFILQTVPQLQPDVVSTLAGLLHNEVTEIGEITGLHNTTQAAINSFQGACREYKKNSEAAATLITEGCSRLQLSTIHEQQKITFTSCHLYTAVRAQNLEAISYLIDELKLPPEISATPYTVAEPMLPHVIEHRLIRVLKMLLEKGYDLSATWAHGALDGVQYVRSRYPSPDREDTLSLWAKKEADRKADPATGYGMMRPTRVM